MSRKYIATVMERIYAGVDNYFFVCRNVVFGDYDEKNKIFIDELGNDYSYMMSQPAISMEVPFSVYNVMSIEDLKKTYKGKSLENIYFDYQTKMQQVVYHVGYTDDYTPFLSVINMDVAKTIASNKEKGNVTVETSNVDKLEKLILDTVDGKYSKEQILDMLEKLYVAHDVLDNTIGTMETAVEAIDENKTYKEYLYEQVEESNKEINTVRPKATPIEGKKDTSELKEKLLRKHKPGLPKDTSIIINPPKKEPRIDIEDVFNKVTKSLISQDEPARRVIAEIARKELHERKKREGILLTGQSGCGKTYLMELIAKYIDKPFIPVDATQITTAGYVGKDIEQVLWDLFIKCGRNIEKAEQAIVYFDEIDKKGSEKNDDVNAKAVLNDLLKFIEGTTYDAQADTKGASQIVKINTSKMTVIFGGAFTDVYNSLKVNNTIGFGTEKNSNDAPKYRPAETKDFVERGMMTNEFMGRVTVIKLNDLTLDDLKRILLEGDESAEKIQEEIFRKMGVKIRFTEGYTNKVAEKAMEKKTGARGLNGIVDESTWKAFEEVYKNEGVYSEVILTEETVEDNSKYQLVKKLQKNKK